MAAALCVRVNLLHITSWREEMPTGMLLGLMRLTPILCLVARLAVATHVRPVVGRRHVLVDLGLGLEPE